MQYGSLNLDGTWTGIVNELIHKNADIGMYLSTVHNGPWGIPVYVCSYFQLYQISTSPHQDPQ